MKYFVGIVLFAICFVSEMFGGGKPAVKEVLDGAVIISLSRCPSRFELTSRLMEQAGFTNIRRFEAIDGFCTEERFFKDLHISNMSPGEKGCAASHLLVWKNFVRSSNKEFLFVAEDDMIPHSNFAKLFPTYWNKTPDSFDIVLVGSHLYAEPSEPLVLARSALNLHAYILSKKGARKLVALYDALPERHSKIVDMFLCDMVQQRRIECYSYNGSAFPDINQGHNDPYKDGGICFQNIHLKSTIR